MKVKTILERLVYGVIAVWSVIGILAGMQWLLNEFKTINDIAGAVAMLGWFTFGVTGYVCIGALVYTMIAMIKEH